MSEGDNSLLAQNNPDQNRTLTRPENMGPNHGITRCLGLLGRSQDIWTVPCWGPKAYGRGCEVQQWTGQLCGDPKTEDEPLPFSASPPRQLLRFFPWNAQIRLSLPKSPRRWLASQWAAVREPRVVRTNSKNRWKRIWKEWRTQQWKWSSFKKIKTEKKHKIIQNLKFFRRRSVFLSQKWLWWTAEADRPMQPMQPMPGPPPAAPPFADPTTDGTNPLDFLM